MTETTLCRQTNLKFMAFKSVGKILSSDQFWQEDKKTLRYIHHQFQDYGYTLAQKLGDINHKAIYIKLAKTTPKHLLEQALSFALDYRDEPNKGRLFMWKLKKLREEVEQKEHLTDFTWQFMWPKIVATSNLLSDQIHKKEQERLLENLEIAQKCVSLLETTKKLKVFDPLVGCGLELDLWQTLAAKLTCWESRKSLSHFSKAKTIYKKDPISAITKLKENQFNIVFLQRLWDLTPLDVQSLLASSIAKSLLPDGIVVTVNKIGAISEQKWELLEHNQQKVWVYTQTRSEEDLISLMQPFVLKQKIELGSGKTAFIWQLLRS